MSFKNLPAFTARLEKKMTTKAAKHIKKSVTRGIMLIEGTAKKSIMSGGSGATVKRYDPSRTHVASKPLESPANDTGFLVSQITTTITPQVDGSVIGQLISSAPYSKALEFGTTNMQPRPFMHPAFESNKRKVLEIFKKEGVIK
tara:strand:- start:190 stop:621 length:432 start_codon:yes stop_codon:yes gene_type:complete